MATGPDPLRAHLARVLTWDEAHVGFDAAVAGVPAGRRGAVVSGLEHSLWQLLEHARIAQHDILDFCVNPSYVHALGWPDDYWPKAPAPPDAGAWDASVAAFRADRDALVGLAGDVTVDLFARVPTGKPGQTVLRGLLLAADHNAYHLGQFVALRRALGIWR